MMSPQTTGSIQWVYMSTLLHEIPQTIISATQELITSQAKQQLMLKPELITQIESGLQNTPQLANTVCTTIAQHQDHEINAAAICMAQAVLVGRHLADTVKHQVALGQSKDAAGRETYSLGDTISSFVINKLIKQFFPTYGILDEESGGYNLDAKRVFTIDPIDGSIAFTRGIDEAWAVGMSLFDKSAVSKESSGIVAAAIAMPQAVPDQELIVGIVSKGCWNLVGQSQGVSQPRYVLDDVRRAVVSIGHKDLRAKVWDKGIATMATHAQRLYAGIDIQHAGAMTARGQIDVLIRAKQLIYDLAPVIGVVEAAGGKCMDFAGQTPQIVLDLKTEQHFIAWNGDEALKQFILECVR